MIILREPLSIPCFFSLSSTRAFYFVFLSRYFVRISPIDGIPMMNAINSTYMETVSSIHKKPPWRTAINFLMKIFTSFPRPKWGISTRFRIPMFFRSVTHCFDCIMVSPNGPVPMLSMYNCCANSDNFLVSAMSWYEYLSLSRHPNRVCVAFTPYGMHGSTIDASIFLRGD
jgi:hypothetical protein